MQHGSAFERGIQVVVCCFLGGEKLKVYSRCRSWNFTDHISLPVLTVHIALLGKAQDSDTPELLEHNGAAIV